GDRPDDVWAWGGSGFMHWDGRTWTRVPGPGSAFGSVTGVGEWWGTLWVRTVGIYPADGAIERHDWCRVGDRWKRDDDCQIRIPVDPPAPTPPAPTSDVAYVGAGELARDWSAHDGRGALPPIELERGYRVGGGEMWAVDKTGRWLAHFDGGT